MVKKQKNNKRMNYIILFIVATLLLAAIAIFVSLSYKAAPAEEKCSAYTDTDVKQCVDVYIGLTEAEAEVKALANGLGSRVTRRDGEGLPVTADYESNRLNFTIEDGRVTKVTSG